jgi:hypothetical protein
MPAALDPDRAFVYKARMQMWRVNSLRITGPAR